jgi:hypothetical protein
MLHYGLFYLHGSRHNPLYPPQPPRGGGGGGPRRPGRFTARSAAMLAAVVLCLGGAGYAAASQDGDAYGDGSDPAKAHPQAADQAEPDSRPGRLGAGPSR